MENSKPFMEGFVSGLAAPMLFLGLNSELPRYENGASMQRAWERTSIGLRNSWHKEYVAHEQRRKKA